MNVVRRPMARLGGRAAGRSSFPGPSTGSGYPWHDGDVLYADDLNSAIASAGQRVTDWLPSGQPDGVTDNSGAIQTAINDSAGKAPLIFPGNANPYIIGTALYIPSNTHLIIEAGATIKIANGANCGCLAIIANASNILIELYGTLDGNASNQPTTGLPSGGITGNGNAPFSNTLIRGGNSGVITNFKNWPINFTGVTDVEANGLTISNSGNSPSMGGVTTRVNVVTGSYTTSSGAVTLNTGTNPHGIHVGDTFTYVAATGAAAQVQGEYVALTVPDAFTVTAQAAAGLVGGNPSLTTGRVGTCAKSSRSGFVNCTVRNIRDIPLCFYGGMVGGYIQGCDLDAGPSIFSDAGQPGSNIDCEISGCYTHDGFSGGPSVVSNQAFIYQHNCRVYDNIVRNMARGGISLGYCDGVEVYGNSLHNNVPAFSGASQQSGQISVSDGTIKANIWGNTIRDPNQSATAQQVIGVTAMTYNNSTGTVTLTLAAAPTLPINVGDRFIAFNMFGFVAPDGTSTSYLQLNGTWTALTGTTGSTVVYTAPAGLGTIALITASTPQAAVIASTLAVSCHIAAGTYSSDASGSITLSTITAHQLAVGDAFVLSGMFGSPSAGLLTGLFTATAVTSMTITFVTVPSLASFAVTSGNLWPSNFGISIASPDYCRIAGNRIGDYQKPTVMTACIGGTWGLNGASDGNYFGPRTSPDPDVSLYGSGVNGFNYDLLFGTTLANNSIDGQVTFRGVTQASNPQSAYYPPQGLTPGWNRSPTPHGEVDFFLGEGLGSPGGFDFLQVAVIKTVASPVGPPIPYDPTTGIVTLTTNTAHGILPGGSFVLSGITGTDTNSGLDVVRLNGSHIANSDTAGTLLTCTVRQGLTITSINAGAAVVPSGVGGGVLKTSVGVGGSLLAGDGYGNTRLGGALVHGAMQSASLVNGGTYTVNPNTSLALIQNAGSIASATVVLPAPAAFAYATGAELELNFQNPIGALSWSGASVAGPAPTIQSAGASLRFVQSGTTWRPMLSDASGVPPVGGPYLPLSGGTVTGATTFQAVTTYGAPGNNLTTITPGSSPTVATTINMSGAGGIVMGGPGPVYFGYCQPGGSAGGNTYPWSGTTPLNPPFLVRANVSGSTSGTSEYPFLGAFVGASANVAAPGAIIDGVGVTYNLGGAVAAAGQWNGLSINLNDGPAATNDKAAGQQGAYVGLQISRRASRNQGGTGLSAATCFGQNWGIDIVNSTYSGATNTALLNGLEINQAIQAGSSVFRRADIQLSPSASHAVRGVYDYGISVIAGIGRQSYKNGITFGGGLSPISPLGADSTLLSMDYAQDFTATAGIGIDFNNATFTTAAIRTPGFLVDPAGNVRVGTGYISGTGTGVAVDTKGSVSTGTPTVNAGGSGWTIGDFADDAYGGTYRVVTVSGDALATVSVLTWPYFNSLSPPATLAITARIGGHLGTATGGVLNVTWDTSRTTLALQPSGGKITSALLTNAANDAAAASAGVIVGQWYRNGSQLMQRVA